MYSCVIQLKRHIQGRNANESCSELDEAPALADAAGLVRRSGRDLVYERRPGGG